MLRALSEQRAAVWYGASQCVLAAAALLAADSVQPAVALLLRGGEAELAYAVAQALRLPLDDAMQELLIELARRAVSFDWSHLLCYLRLQVNATRRVVLVTSKAEPVQLSMHYAIHLHAQ
jgi:hypothetical protein